MTFRRRLRFIAPRVAAALAATAVCALTGCGLIGTSTDSTTGPATATAAGSDTGSASPTTVATLHVVVLGDSVATAANCDCDDFGQRATTQLATLLHRPTQLDNLAVGGATTTDVLQLLRRRDAQASLARADLVVIQIGANDFDEADAYTTACLQPKTSGCASQTYATVSANLASIVETVQSISQINRPVVGLMDYWNIFRDGTVAQREGATYAAASRAMSQLFSDDVRTVAHTTGVTFVDATTPLVGDGSKDPTGLLTDDGDHPDDAGQQALADALVDAVGAELLARRS